jgi:cell wall-associated NlpC family hydrolase
MRLGTCLFAFIPFTLGVTIAPAEAAHTHHHPWGYHGPESETPIRTKKTQSSAAPVVLKTAQATKPAPSLDLIEPDEDSEPSDNAGRNLASRALAYKGTRYKFGGSSKKGMDCSGLVARIYADLRMHRVPRVSSALYKSGRPVRSEELRPGDLVFFQNTYKHGISHVGVYAGNNKFVHAANKKHGVIVTSMADPYYQLHFAGARRLY